MYRNYSFMTNIMEEIFQCWSVIELHFTCNL